MKPEKTQRVLGRAGARELMPTEIDHVTGGIRTETVCTLGKSGALDGDTFLGEC
jgi:hypothetical protein